MKAMMISKPSKIVANVLNGLASILIFKTCPKDWKDYLSGKTKEMPEPTDVYIYCTKDQVEMLFKSLDDFYYCYAYQLFENDINLNGKVVAKFTLNNVEEIRYFDELQIPDGYEDYDGNWVDTSEYAKDMHWVTRGQLEQMCLSYDELHKYLDKKTGYAWHISNLEIFDESKEISDFRKPRYCDCKLRCNNNLEHSFCREVCSHNLDSERLSVCCDRDGWIKEWNTGNMNLTKAPQNFCYVEALK